MFALPQFSTKRDRCARDKESRINDTKRLQQDDPDQSPAECGVWTSPHKCCSVKACLISENLAIDYQPSCVSLPTINSSGSRVLCFQATSELGGQDPRNCATDPHSASC
ncbi:hypothetical protein pipiens_001443 [Culex pipiens pipiens]|uniref:Uncharacterized protein n=1 Tax=Culex pipiens pipiens TaxID=38569 RepID=A0ABD1CT79_CULPP